MVNPQCDDIPNRKVLTIEEIWEAHTEIPEWMVGGTRITRHFEFKEFTDVVSFLIRISRAMIEENHHPQVEFGKRYVKIISTSNKAGKILTQKDFDIAKRIDKLYTPSINNSVIYGDSKIRQ